MRLLPRCAAIAALLLASCASSSGSRDPWVYGLSRGFYSSTIADSPTSYSNPDRPNDGAAVAFAVLLVLPFALDTVLLPVTVPHDLLFVE